VASAKIGISTLVCLAWMGGHVLKLLLVTNGILSAGNEFSVRLTALLLPMEPHAEGLRLVGTTTSPFILR
jgi:hypothetical protein